MSARRSEERSGRALALAGFVLLTVWFTALGFPRDELGAALLERVEEATGSQATFASVETSLGWCLPTLRARRGRLAWPTGSELQVSYARIRPRFAWGWLIGRPSFSVKLVVKQRSTFKGWIAPGRGALVGTLDDVVLGDLPYELLGIRTVRASGSGEAAVSLERGETAWVGSVRVRARDGVFQLNAAPLPIPFTSFAGEFELRPEAVALTDDLRVESPMGRVGIRGEIARGVPDPGLNLELDLDLEEPTLLRVLADLGLQIRPGAERVSIGGTLSNPRARAGRR